MVRYDIKIIQPMLIDNTNIVWSKIFYPEKQYIAACDKAAKAGYLE
jgi:hypothetical protein